MTLSEIQSAIEALEKNSLLYLQKNFDSRTDAIEYLEFEFNVEIQLLLQTTSFPGQVHALKHRAEKVRSRLKETDTKLFQKLQAILRAEAHTGKAFNRLVRKYFDLNSCHTDRLHEPGYDNLDIFINRLFPFQTIPLQTMDLEPEMVYYQKTPARIIFEMAERSAFTPRDVFIDLGSGLGQAAILLHLITGVSTRGIELEPAFCQYARDTAAWLNLCNVTFVNADARKADYADGTVFFMYTPFEGKLLGEVLEILRKESLRRKIRIITYGPCTAHVALQSWLNFAPLKDYSAYELGFFNS